MNGGKFVGLESCIQAGSLVEAFKLDIANTNA